MVQEDDGATILLDFAAAFPSVSHRWLFAVLNHIGLPRGFIAFVAVIYCENEAKYGSGKAALTLFVIVAGILQGCPGSGSFFVLALEPFLWKFDCILKAQDRRRVGVAGPAVGGLGATLAVINLCTRPQERPRIFHILPLRVRITGVHLMVCVLVAVVDCHAFLRGLLEAFGLPCKELRDPITVPKLPEGRVRE